MSEVRRSVASGILVVVLALTTACGSRVVLSSGDRTAGPAGPAVATSVTQAAAAPTPTTAAPEVAVGELTPATAAPVASIGGSPAPPHVFSVATAGNGILYDIEPALRASLGTPQFFNHALGGFGISVLPDVWHGVFGNDVPSSNPDVVIVMMGQRDFPVALADPNAYRAELDDAVRMLSAKGARILWLGLPPQPPTMLDDAGRRAVNALFAELPQRFPGIVRYVPTDPVLAAPDGSFARSLPDAGGRLVPVRKLQPTGIPDEHICPDGARRVAELVRAELAKVVALPPAPPLWQSAEWRGEPRYDDPVGACRT